MLIFLLQLLGCSEEPFVFNKKMNQCKPQYFYTETVENGVSEVFESEYIWTEEGTETRVDFQSKFADELYNYYRIYNEQGFLIEEYQENLTSEYEVLANFEYDCTEDWCWRANATVSSMTDFYEYTEEMSFEWSGKTETFYSKQGYSGYTLYNDYFEVTEHLWEFNNEFSKGYQEYLYEYECDNWCKLQSLELTVYAKEKRRVQIPGSWNAWREMATTMFKKEEFFQEDSAEYNWEGDQIVSENGYSSYNEYGYPFESYYEYDSGWSMSETVYDCED